jgi:hypothetical protein
MPARYSTPADSAGSPGSVNDVATFQPGVQLQVWRGYYYHHGSYISDDRFTQFGGGVTLLNKHGTSVGEVSLKGEWFFRKAGSDAALTFWMGGRSRTNRPIPRWGRLAIVGWVVVGVAAIGTYNHQIKRFWDEILVDWQAHERTLDKDPRNGLTG